MFNAEIDCNQENFSRLMVGDHRRTNKQVRL